MQLHIEPLSESTMWMCVACQGDHKEMERLYNVCHCENRSVILIGNNIIQLVRIFAPDGLLNDGLQANQYPVACNLVAATCVLVY